MNNKLKIGAAVFTAFALTLGGAGTAFASQTTTDTGSTGAVYLASGDDGSAIDVIVQKDHVRLPRVAFHRLRQSAQSPRHPR